MAKNQQSDHVQPKERVDDLQNGFYVIQNPEKFCFGMDAVLLSGFANIRKNETVLDMGTGTGIIPILLKSKGKGGHLTGHEMCDVLYDGKELNIFGGRRIHSANLHGTGCTLSSAIATFLAQGSSLYEAVEQAKEYISCAIEAGKNLRIGQGNGPLWHFPFPTPPVNEG